MRDSVVYGDSPVDVFVSWIVIVGVEVVGFRVTGVVSYRCVVYGDAILGCCDA